MHLKSFFLGVLVVISSIVSLAFTMEEPTNPQSKPPLEVYVIDQETLPKATGVKGSTYTAQLYIVDNQKQQVFGPYQGSSFPNSKQSKEDPEKPNTLKAGAHIFNNKYGHKGGTKQGLNLINVDEQRITDAFSWFKKPSKIRYANVHTGCSDNGNFNSRGSQGCITIHPKQVDAFFKHFDFSKGTKGTSEGIVYIYRANATKRLSFIDQIKTIY